MSLINLNQMPFPPSPGDDGSPAERRRPVGQRLGLPEPAACPHGSDAIYLLAHNDSAAPAPGYAQGWTLSAWTGSTSLWSADLASHGAGALTSPDHAKAVALRALRDRGVPVESWTTAHLDLPAFRAVLCHVPSHETVARSERRPGAPSRTQGERGRWRRWRFPGR
jgi:hypothetical protein